MSSRRAAPLSSRIFFRCRLTKHQPAAALGDQEQVEKAAANARELPDLAARAANDDQQSIGQILQALQRRPARSSYFVAASFSGAWIIGCLALSLAYMSDLHAALEPAARRSRS